MPFETFVSVDCGSVTLGGQMIKWYKLNSFYVYAYISRAYKVPASYLVSIFPRAWLFICATLPLVGPRVEPEVNI